VEKGFQNKKEHNIAKGIFSNTFILSQYRFSKIFEVLKKYEIGNIIKCDYEWEVDGGIPSEWVPHIISIDNYLKENNLKFYIKDFGTYRIDNISDFTLKKSNARSLKIYLKTDNADITLELGKENSYKIFFKLNGMVEKNTYENEDCLLQQLKSIFIQNDLIKLERLK
jgi:hypothetical protein